MNELCEAYGGDYCVAKAVVVIKNTSFCKSCAVDHVQHEVEGAILRLDQAIIQQALTLRELIK